MQRKSFRIPKSLVWKSYKEVKRNKSAPGIDGQTIADFDANREKNLYKIWNRLSSGSYFPPPVLEMSIPKKDGTERILGIPTVSDRIAQGAVKIYIEAYLEPIFHEDSYGYRPKRSAHQAIEVCSKRCWRQNWILEVDIKGFFDNMSHYLVIKALQHHAMPKWVILYCTRWMQAPMCRKSSKKRGSPRKMGTPQGGVISPVLANLFLHYAFDKWMDRTFHEIKFERYADDIVCHCKNMKAAVALKQAIKYRLQSLGLKINENKSNVVYIGAFQSWNVKTCFTFLGYDFKVRPFRRNLGKVYMKCIPGASNKAMKRITQIIKKWKIHRATVESAEIFAHKYNPTLRGWIEYYGKFWHWKFDYHLWTVFQYRLLKWVKCKFRLSNKKAIRKLALLRKENPKLFAHWYLLRA